MTLLLRKLLYVLFFGVATLPSAWALSCGIPVTPTYQMQLHSIIFRGRPLTIKDIPNSSETASRYVSIEFEVVQALKGFKGDRITIKCGAWYYSCRAIFKIGEERVVFAGGFEKPHTVSGCDQQVFGETVERLLKPLAEAMAVIDAQLGKQLESPLALWLTRVRLYEMWDDKLQQLEALKNLVKFETYKSSRNIDRLRILELLVRMRRFDEALQYATDLLSARKRLEDQFKDKSTTKLADELRWQGLDNDTLRIAFDPAFSSVSDWFSRQNERMLTLDEALEVIKLQSGAPFDVSKIDFTGMALWNLNLQGLNLQGVSFSKAIFHRTDLRGSNLAAADLSQSRQHLDVLADDATYDCHTKFPDRFDPEQRGMAKAEPFCP